MLKPFAKDDFWSYDGFEGRTPLIAEVRDLTVIVDEDCVMLLFGREYCIHKTYATPEEAVTHAEALLASVA